MERSNVDSEGDFPTWLMERGPCSSIHSWTCNHEGKNSHALHFENNLN